MKRRAFVTKNNNGYILILTVLVIAAASLTITLGLSKLLLDQLILQTSQVDGLKALVLTETGAEDGLEKLRNNWQDYNYTLSINGNSCTINIVTDDFQAQLISIGSSGDYTKRINVTIDRVMEVVSWQQM